MLPSLQYADADPTLRECKDPSQAQGHVIRARAHSLNLYGTLMLGQLLYPDEMSKKLVILGVEALDVDSFNAGLSPKVEQSIPNIIGTIKEELGN